MSELSVKVREAQKKKAESYMRADPRGMKIDASGYEPPDALDADVKTGMRPVSRRQYARGGKIEKMLECYGGAPKPRADRKARASGGEVYNQLLGDVKPAHSYPGGAEFTESYTKPLHPADREHYAKGGSANEYMNRDQKEANQERDGSKHIGGFKKGGRAKRDVGGTNMPQPMAAPMGASAVNPVQNALNAVKNAGDGNVPAAALNVTPQGYSAARRLSGIGFKKGGSAKKAGGSVSDGEMEGTRPTGGRLARKSGGKAKGSVNIIISTGHAPSPGMPAMPPGPVRPPMAAPAGGLPPGVGAPPPAMMPPMMGRKAGGKVYRSAADMDAGALSGLGRLEKSEIQKNKR